MSVKTYSRRLKKPREAIQQDWVQSNNFLVTEVILISRVRSFSLRASFVLFLFRQCSPLNVCTQFNSLLNSNACKHFHPCTRVASVHLFLDLQSCSCIFMYELITLRWWWWWGFHKGEFAVCRSPALCSHISYLHLLSFQVLDMVLTNDIVLSPIYEYMCFNSVRVL